MPPSQPAVSPSTPSRATGALLDELLDLAGRAAAAAAGVVRDGLSRDHVDSATKSSPTDVVTEVDRASEALLVHLLLDARPDDGVLGEEGADVVGTSGVRWIVDPLDGTTNFLYGLPGCNVSVGAELDGVPVVGVVDDPLNGDVFRARLGGGATRNGRPIRPSARTDLAAALVATGFGYDADLRRRQAETLVEVLPRVRDLRRLGAAATDLCSVGCGRIDAYWEKGLAPWDVAAGRVVATEAGAVVGDPAELGYVLAAPPALYGPLRELLDAAGAAEA